MTASYKLYFCQDLVFNVIGINILSSSLTVAKQRIFNCNKNKFVCLPCYQLISEHFGENRVTL